MMDRWRMETPAKLGKLVATVSVSGTSTLAVESRKLWDSQRTGGVLSLGSYLLGQNLLLESLRRVSSNISALLYNQMLGHYRFPRLQTYSNYTSGQKPDFTATKRKLSNRGEAGQQSPCTRVLLLQLLWLVRTGLESFHANRVLIPPRHMTGSWRSFFNFAPTSLLTWKV